MPCRVCARWCLQVALFETQSRRVLNEIQGWFFKYVVWSPDCSYVALLAKNAVVIADRNLKQICAVTESMPVRPPCPICGAGLILRLTPDWLGPGE